jgi:hypothetical protein
MIRESSGIRNRKPMCCNLEVNQSSSVNSQHLFPSLKLGYHTKWRGEASVVFIVFIPSLIKFSQS